LATRQAALNRAVERHNMTRFTPVGHARDLTVTTLRLVIEAIADGDTALAAAILDQAEPESPGDTAPTVADCIGVALGVRAVCAISLMISASALGLVVRQDSRSSRAPEVTESFTRLPARRTWRPAPTS
jgi:hypothetical protein